MNLENESQLRRIERSSAFFRGCCTAVLVTLSVATVVAVVAALAGRLTHIHFAGQSLAIPSLPLGTRAWVGVLVLATGAAAIKGLYHLRRLLDNYSRREIFTSNSARQIRDLGVTCILWGAVKVLWAFLSASLGNHLAPSVDIAGDAFVIGGVVFVIARFAQMAVALREENDLTI